MGFGSETGQSKSIAQGIGDIVLEQHQISADIFELDEIDKQVRKWDTGTTNSFILIQSISISYKFLFVISKTIAEYLLT